MGQDRIGDGATEGHEPLHVEVAVQRLDDQLRVDRLGGIDLHHDRHVRVLHRLAQMRRQLVVERPRPLPGLRGVLVAVRSDIVEREEAAVLGQHAADLAEDAVDHRNVVGGRVVDNQVERPRWEFGRIDVHLVVRQRKAVRAGLPAGFAEQPLRVVDADACTDDAVHHHLPLDPSVPTIEEQCALERLAAAGEVVVEPAAGHATGDALVEHPLGGVEIVPIPGVVVDTVVLVDVEFGHQPPPRRRPADSGPRQNRPCCRSGGIGLIGTGYAPRV